MWWLNENQQFVDLNKMKCYQTANKHCSKDEALFLGERDYDIDSSVTVG